MLIVFQFLFIVFSLLAVGNVIKKKREGSLSVSGAGLWIGFWFLADLAVIWPNSTTILANALGIGRGSDLVIYLSLALLFFGLFRLHLKIEGMNRDVTRVVRRQALSAEAKPPRVSI